MVEHEVTGPVDRISKVLGRVSMWLTAWIVLIIFYEVVMRYIFSKPTLWVNEMSLWVAGMVYLFAGLYAMQQRSHIRIFILYDIVPRWLQRTFDVISTALICVFTFALIWGGSGEAYAKFMRWEKFGTAWDPPIPATMKPLILITLVAISIQAISNLIHDWNKEPEVHTPADEL